MINVEYLDDGFGNLWDPICQKCGKRTIEIVRPGKVQCGSDECSRTQMEPDND